MGIFTMILAVIIAMCVVDYVRDFRFPTLQQLAQENLTKDKE